MAQLDAVYIGLRGPQLPSGHGGPTVVGVREGTRSRTLTKHPDAVTLPDDFEWGYQGAGPGVLAEAILADRLGFNPDPQVSTALAREVVPCPIVTSGSQPCPACTPNAARPQ